ncbi:TetR/AcrR family transcriptional regulator C-terminal domain-containing protein [Paenibacillus sp. NRS-1782]|uniref:TetR/AcrR family transcriptional regulator C-terminal domain-containing protein n=1 Tax=unclassified Paenibacillus TaxID=185978 RepID=UPI003D2BFF73
MSIKQDLRALRTKKSIECGFTELLNMSSFSSITVQDIANKAMINRSTFYLHFQDKYDLLDKLGNRIIDEFSSCIEFDDIKQYNSILRVVRHIQANATTYRALISINTETLNFAVEIQRIFENLCNNWIYRYEIKEKSKGAGDYFLRLFASSCLTTIKWWIEVNNNLTVDEVSDLINQCFEQGMNNSFRI